VITQSSGGEENSKQPENEEKHKEDKIEEAP
jgi:hypothetical protein